MNDAFKVVIADDHPVFRSGLRHIIETDHSITVVGEASNGEEALAMIQELKPDAAILDIEMPRLSGLEAAKRVQERGLAVHLVILTMYADEEMFNAAMDLGVAGYVLKENAVSEVLNSIKAVAKGQYYISPNISGYLVERSKRRQQALSALPALTDLTPTEWRVLRLIAGKKTSKDIARDLEISIKTVENHRANIMDKLGLHGSNALLKFALEHKTLL